MGEDKFEKFKELKLDQTPADMILSEYQLKGTSPPVYITKVTDLTPVNEFVKRLEETLDKEESRRKRAWVDITAELIDSTKEMNQEQLCYLTVHLIGIAEKYASLYQSTLDKPEEHLRFVREYRKLEKMMKG